MSPIMDADVVIIGAGLSGLQAARSLADAGITTVLLEARSRVGGKTFSVAHQNNVGIADLGAEWLNDTTHPLVYRLAKSLHLELGPVTVQGDAVLHGLDGNITRHTYGQQAPLPNGEDKLVGRMRELFEEEYNKIDLATCQGLGHDDMTLEAFVQSHGGGAATLATVGVWTRVMLGCQPSELSAAYFFMYCKSQGGLMKMRSGKTDGRYMAIKTGTQSLAQGLAASLPPESIKLGAAVNRVSQTGTGVTVHSRSGHVFHARKAIVAISTPLYANIVFDPPLSPGKALLVASTRLGRYTKVSVTYPRAWWREQGLCGSSQSFIGPAAATRDTSDDSGSLFRLTGFIAGPEADRFSRLTPTERRRAVCAQLADMFNSREAEEPTEYLEQPWSEEEWSLGCPCPYTPPGILSVVGDHMKEVHGHVHFVGTETAEAWKGYMEGALASGIRGAEEVMMMMKK